MQRVGGRRCCLATQACCKQRDKAKQEDIADEGLKDVMLEVAVNRPTIAFVVLGLAPLDNNNITD